jgi:hypothetical protein
LATNKTLDDLDPHTVAPETVVWLKCADSSSVSTFLDILVKRGLDLHYVGPKDRYVVKAQHK